MKKVAVAGPGAMGCLFAARLAKSGVRVYLVDHDIERISRLDGAGIVVEAEGGDIHAQVQMAQQPPTGMDLILVLVKSHHTSALRFPPDTPILTLQNGLGNVEILSAAVGSARILAGATTEAATLLSEGRVQHSASGTTYVGSWTSCPPGPAVELLQDAGFNTEITESPGQVIWEKAAINAAINPLTALVGAPNGYLLEVTELRQLMRDLVVEATKIACSEGYRFPYSLVERAEEVCRATASNLSSMLQDIRAGKETEIDAISGEILRRATLAAQPVPRTRVVYQLLRGLEGR